MAESLSKIGFCCKKVNKIQFFYEKGQYYAEKGQYYLFKLHKNEAKIQVSLSKKYTKQGGEQ